MKKTLGDGKCETSFGAAFPEFYVNCEWSSAIERTPKGHIVPKVATVNDRPLLLRVGIFDEEVAGKLFSFCYRVMYGAVAASDVVAERNSLSRPACQDGETTAPLSPIVRTDPKFLQNTSSSDNLMPECLCDQKNQDTRRPNKGSIDSCMDSPIVDASGSSP